MTDRRPTLADVLDGLEADGLLPGGDRERADRAAESISISQPWYVRTMVGGGAWLASLLLVGFIAGFFGATAVGRLVLGSLMIAAALLARRRFDTDFWIQGALAVSLAGQALLSFGFAEIVDWDAAEPVVGFVVVMSLVLFVLFPDRIHRVLMVMIAGGAFTLLLYLWELNALVPVVGPLMAAGLVVLAKSPARFYAGGRGDWLRPLVTGLMLNAFGCLLLSAVYVLPELIGDFRFYPRPWISTLLLGALFLYAGSEVWPRLAAGRSAAAIALLYGLLALVIAAAWAMPGLLLALVVILLGAATADRYLMGAGLVFLPVFVGAFFYGIEVSLLAKSITLVAAGAAILLARRVLLGMLGAEAASAEVGHA